MMFGSDVSEVFLLIGSAGIIVKVVLAILMFLSVSSWTIIIYKAGSLRRARKASNAFLDIFWKSNRLDTMYETAQGTRNSPIAEVFKAGYLELTQILSNRNAKERNAPSEPGPVTVIKDIGGIDNINRALRRASTAELTKLENLVAFLATTGSTAPFIGLFGTVWGIMNSFINIGKTHDTSLAVVAPGISEALIATAVGLFAAIPAVVFYNIFVTRIRIISSEIDNFSNDFTNVIKRHFF